MISFALASSRRFEVTLVLGMLAVKFDAWFAGITLIAPVFCITFTVLVTNWRAPVRKTMRRARFVGAQPRRQHAET
jgi:ATP-binding cassette subfamily B protein